MLLHCRRYGIQFWRAVWTGLMAVAAVAGIAAAEKAGTDGKAAPGSTASTAEEPAPDRSAGRRVREGTELVDRVGRFELSGKRLLFVADRDQLRLVGLENLNLERVYRTLAGSPSPVRWKVCGTVTECQGVNYLLLHRAVVTTTLATRGESVASGAGQ